MKDIDFNLFLSLHKNEYWICYSVNRMCFEVLKMIDYGTSKVIETNLKDEEEAKLMIELLVEEDKKIFNLQMSANLRRQAS